MTTMEYMLMFYESKADFAARNDAKASETYWGAWMAYSKALTEASVRKGTGNALQPPATATTLRMNGSERRVQDGPFADAKEQLGGYMIIEAPNLDEALKWAARAPCAVNGAVEVRPVLDTCGD